MLKGKIEKVIDDYINDMKYDKGNYRELLSEINNDLNFDTFYEDKLKDIISKNVVNRALKIPFNSEEEGGNKTI